MLIADACTREVVIVEPHDPILTAVKLMRDQHVGDVVVVEEQEDGKRVPVGILTDRDILVEVTAEDVDIDSITVGDVMSDDLLTADEDNEISDVIKQMRSEGVRRVPVVDSNGALAGILSLDDLIDLLTEQMSDLVALIGREQRRERVNRV